MSDKLEQKEVVNILSHLNLSNWRIRKPFVYLEYDEFNIACRALYRQCHRGLRVFTYKGWIFTKSKNPHN